MPSTSSSPVKRYPKRGQTQVARIRAHASTSSSDTLEEPLYSKVLVAAEDLPDVAATEGDEEGTVQYFGQFRRKNAPLPDPKSKSRKAVDPQEDEIFKIGDTVFVEAEGTKKTHHIAVLTQLWSASVEGDEEEDEEVGEGRKYARVHWFHRQAPFSLKKKRPAEKDEIYYSHTSQCSPLPLSSIIGHCTVTATRTAPEEIYYDLFVCYYALDKLKDNYWTIDWDEVRGRGMEEGLWNLELGEDDAESEAQPERPKKRKRRELEHPASEDEASGEEYAPSGGSANEDAEADGDGEAHDVDEASDADSQGARPPHKARKSRPSSSPNKTPRKRRSMLAKPTPNSKLRLKAKASRSSLKSPTKTRRRVPIPSNSKWAASLPTDPYLRALATLHVSATPDDLPCRDNEFQQVLDKVEGLLEEGEGGCIYISGVPGTGKTATVHAVVRTLHARAQSSDIPPFTFFEVNGLKLTDAREAYTELWRVVSGDDTDKRVSPGEALRRLVSWFERSGRRGPEAGCFVVLMDELDQLITTKQDVVYNFFNWPTLPGSRLVVIAVANTMDLPERVMAGKVRSRLGMERINFAPYTRDQLKEIVNSRLRGGTVPPENIMHADAIQIAAMRVAGVSGDARRILDISRRAVELARQADGGFRTVKIDDINAVMKQMQNSPSAAYLRECSYMEKVMLVAVVKVVRREGVSDVKWGDVTYQHLGLYATLGEAGLPPARPTSAELKMVLRSLMAAKVLLFEEGALAARKAEVDRKVQLGLESGEIERVLGDWGGQTWKNLLGVN